MSIIIEYKDPLNLSEELLKLGQSTRITQFENGGGTYKISPLQYKSVSVAQIESTKTLLYEGWGNGETIDFYWITRLGRDVEGLGRCDGYKMTPNSLAGFATISPQPRNSWGRYTNNCTSTACMVRKSDFIDYLHKCKAYNALERIDGDSGMECEPKHLAQLKRLVESNIRRQEEGIDNKYFEILTACLEQPITVRDSSQSTKNIDLLREIVKLAHDSDVMTKPLTLAAVCRQIHTSQASLYRICQESFGMGIIEMMTQIRLEESRRVLLNSELRYELKLRSIREIAIHFGFKHQGRYARRYATTYDELPSQTIERARYYQIGYSPIKVASIR